MIRFAILPACVALLLSCTPTHPSEDVTPAQQENTQEPDLVLAEMGEPRFLKYCASCHGIEARGDGPVGQLLQVPPPDLRRIAARRGGHFPGGEIARKIDGRFEIAPHGTREMPVWGQAFGANVPSPGMGESIARGQIAVIVEYLKSIQDPPGAAAESAELRQTMGEVFTAMRVLLPLSISSTGFENPNDADRIRGALALLDRSSAQLAQHGASSDVAFAHLARSLSIDARDVRQRYESGHTREARYLVQTLTETCVACHSRLPSESAPRSAAFVRDVTMAELPIAKRAKLAYATRQFDVALELYERVLADRELPANEIDMGDHLDDYLELAIRVKRDPQRAASALTAFARRDDVSSRLREEVEGWLAALAKIPPVGDTGDPLRRARDLVVAGGEHIEGDRRKLIEYFEASGVLHRALEGPLQDAQRAEAYYLLGLIETRTARTYWLSQAEAHLETAIRLAPGQPIAMDAYHLLEEFLVSGYTGTAGMHVPPDVGEKLDQLRWIAEPPRDA